MRVGSNSKSQDDGIWLTKVLRHVLAESAVSVSAKFSRRPVKVH